MTLEVPLLVPGIRLDRDADAEEKLALERASQPWLAGFILFGGEAEQVAVLTQRLREEAGRDIFIASDMERGAGQQIEGLTKLPDAGLVGFAGTSNDAWAFGKITAAEARSVGIDVIFAPVVDVRSEIDNPIVGNRSFGWEPGRVATLAAAFCAGARRGGAMPVAKHYPGHGATTEDSHDAVPVVDEPADVLLARDLRPFHYVIRTAKCPAIMTAHVAYPSLDKSGKIATFSLPIIDALRQEVGLLRHPLVFTDALLMTGATKAGSEVEAARLALLAGCDVLLYPEEPELVAAKLLERKAGRLAGPVESAAARIAHFTEKARALETQEDPGDEMLADAPDRVAQWSVYLATRGQLFLDSGPLDVFVDDADASAGAVLAECAQAAGVDCRVVSVAHDKRPVIEASGEDLPTRTIVVLSRVGAWKGAAGVSDACRAMVKQTAEQCGLTGWLPQFILCAPRSEPAWHTMHIPGTGPHLERALGAVLYEHESA